MSHQRTHLYHLGREKGTVLRHESVGSRGKLRLLRTLRVYAPRTSRWLAVCASGTVGGLGRKFCWKAITAQNYTGTDLKQSLQGRQTDQTASCRGWDRNRSRMLLCFVQGDGCHRIRVAASTQQVAL